MEKGITDKIINFVNEIKTSLPLEVQLDIANKALKVHGITLKKVTEVLEEISEDERISEDVRESYANKINNIALEIMMSQIKDVLKEIESGVIE